MRIFHKTSCLFFIIIFIHFFGISASENKFFISGLDYYKNKEFSLAAAHFEEAKRLEPKYHLTYFYLGNIYYQLEELDNAILNYTAGLNYTDGKGPFFYNLGNCYYLKKNYAFSADMYSKAVLYNPTLFNAHLNSGNAFYKIGDYANTIEQWEAYLIKYPETPQYDKIEKAIAYLRGELSKPSAEELGIDEKTGLDVDLLGDVMTDLEELINKTENIMETSEKPIDDLTSEDIER